MGGEVVVATISETGAVSWKEITVDQYFQPMDNYNNK